MDAALPRIVARPIEPRSHEGEAFANAPAQRRRMLADPGREDEGIEPAERRDEGTCLPQDAIDEEVERFLGARLRARLEHAHIAAHARHAEKPGAVVEEISDRFGSLLPDELEDEPGI